MVFLAPGQEQPGPRLGIARARIAGVQLGRQRGTVCTPGLRTGRTSAGLGAHVPGKPGDTDHFHTQRRGWRQGGGSHPSAQRLRAPVPIPQLLPGRGRVATAARPLGPRLPGRRGGRGLHGRRRRALSVSAVLNAPERRECPALPGSARLGAALPGLALPGPPWPGSARFGSVRLCPTRHSTARLGSARLSSALPGWALRGSARRLRGRGGGGGPGAGAQPPAQESCGGNCEPPGQPGCRGWG